ncbi:MAG: FG-GAP repeat domain-containing protein, partial [Planctomycetota bacterium]
MFDQPAKMPIRSIAFTAATAVLVTALAGSDATAAECAHPFFADSVNYESPGWPHGLAAGDLDGDGDADLAMAGRFGNVVSILLNNGDGTFVPGDSCVVGIEPVEIAIDDFDGDQNLDLAVANLGSDDVSILWNLGGATFAPAVSYAAGDGPSSVAAGDLNGDLVPDLAVVNVIVGN